jgi:hypothetical protein
MYKGGLLFVLGINGRVAPYNDEDQTTNGWFFIWCTWNISWKLDNFEESLALLYSTKKKLHLSLTIVGTSEKEWEETGETINFNTSLFCTVLISSCNKPTMAELLLITSLLFLMQVSWIQGLKWIYYKSCPVILYNNLKLQTLDWDVFFL